MLIDYPPLLEGVALTENEGMIPMSMDQKVKLPTQVCEALNKARESCSDASIVAQIQVIHHYEIDQVLVQETDADVIMCALVWGYEPLDLNCEAEVKEAFFNSPFAQNPNLNNKYQEMLRGFLLEYDDEMQYPWATVEYAHENTIFDPVTKEYVWK